MALFSYTMIEGSLGKHSFVRFNLNPAGYSAREESGRVYLGNDCAVLNAVSVIMIGFYPDKDSGVLI